MAEAAVAEDAASRAVRLPAALLPVALHPAALRRAVRHLVALNRAAVAAVVAVDGRSEISLIMERRSSIRTKFLPDSERM